MMLMALFAPHHPLQPKAKHRGRYCHQDTYRHDMTSEDTTAKLSAACTISCHFNVVTLT